MTIVIPHPLPPEDALARVKGLLTLLRQKHADKIANVQEEWSGNGCRFAFTAMGMPVQGQIAVLNGQVRIDGKLPFAAMFFQGKIEQTIRQAAAETLSTTPAPPPAAPPS
jgi:hypothetical protein